jgi:hypothetical protein
VNGRSPETWLLWLIKDFITTRIFAAMSLQQAELLSLVTNTLTPGDGKN